MIVIGVDPHKDTHTAAAVDEATGRMLEHLTVRARRAGYQQLWDWSRALDPDRIWAIEDVRNLSGGLERFLLIAGERVVRVPPKLMSKVRKSAREYGKSDPIDATAIARAALREPDLPPAAFTGPAHDIALLSNHRDALVADSTRIMRRLRWLLHDLDPTLEPPTRTLSQRPVIDRLARRLRQLPQTAQVRVARDQLRLLRTIAGRVNELERELGVLVRRHAKPLLAIPGCGVLTAARIVGDVDDIQRFASDAKLATYAGVAPLDASSGRQQRHRLNRTGNRRLNRALHIIAVTQARTYKPARDYLARRLREGKTAREALRALKRLLIRLIYRTLQLIAQHRDDLPTLPGTAPLACLN